MCLRTYNNKDFVPKALKASLDTSDSASIFWIVSMPYLICFWQVEVLTCSWIRMRLKNFLFVVTATWKARKWWNSKNNKCSSSCITCVENHTRSVRIFKKLLQFSAVLCRCRLTLLTPLAQWLHEAYYSCMTGTYLQESPNDFSDWY
jgi:hypothetical protein